MLVLHSYRRCPFAIRVRMVLEEKAIPYQLIEEDLGNLSSELLALHPEGRVPLLIVRGTNARQVIYQSNIITEYLDEAFPENPLMPPPPSERAEIRLWTYWCDQIFKPDLDMYKYETKGLAPTELRNLLDRLESHLNQWELQLGKSQYLIGNSMTLADIHLFPFARQFFAIKPTYPELGKYPRLAQWLDKIINRPSFSRVIQK